MSDLSLPFRPFSHMGLRVECIPAPGVTENDLVRQFRRVGNPILDVVDSEEGRVLLAVEQVEPIAYVDAPLGAFLWQCDKCGRCDESRALVEQHEATCEGTD